MYDYVWMNGNVIEEKEATIPIYSLGFLMGMSVFEAVRIYQSFDGKYVHCFRLNDHIDRLFKSLKISRINLKYNKDEIIDAVHKLMLVNKVNTDAYIRLTVYCISRSPGSSIFDPNDVEYELLISIAKKDRVMELKGIRCTVSSWKRISDCNLPPRVKAAANYQNTRLAGYEAKLDGYDNCLFLNDMGKISEAGESAIILFDGNEVITPDKNSDILESITRDTVLYIIKNILKIPVNERMVDRTELYTAYEVFLTNTAKLIRPVVDIDNYKIADGCIGKITSKVWHEFEKVTRRENEINDSWYCNSIELR